MDQSDTKREKLSQNHLERQAKPFLDKNFQLQIPGTGTTESASTFNPIYTHYMHLHQQTSALETTVNEKELNQAMKEADRSFQAWKKMKDVLLNKFNQIVKHK